MYTDNAKHKKKKKKLQHNLVSSTPVKKSFRLSEEKYYKHKLIYIACFFFPVICLEKVLYVMNHG